MPRKQLSAKRVERHYRRWYYNEHRRKAIKQRRNARDRILAAELPLDYDMLHAAFPTDFWEMPRAPAVAYATGIEMKFPNGETMTFPDQFVKITPQGKPK